MATGMRRSTILKNYGGVFSMPGGFKVRVDILDKNDARDQMGSQVLAQYYHDDHLIVLKRSRSDKQRKSDLEHELQHMCVDWIDHFVRKARVIKKRHK
jgi:Zn-dependent peptidase ImmA (M78 family)